MSIRLSRRNVKPTANLRRFMLLPYPSIPIIPHSPVTLHALPGPREGVPTCLRRSNRMVRRDIFSNHIACCCRSVYCTILSSDAKSNIKSEEPMPWESPPHFQGGILPVPSGIRGHTGTAACQGQGPTRMLVCFLSSKGHSLLSTFGTPNASGGPNANRSRLAGRERSDGPSISACSVNRDADHSSGCSR
jgi:hypothetical protein